MADIYLTIKELETLFQSITLEILGYADAITAYNAWLASGENKQDLEAGDIEILENSSPTLLESSPMNPYELVRIAWQTEGQPAWKIGEDICFIRCQPADNPITRQREMRWIETAVPQALESGYGELLESGEAQVLEEAANRLACTQQMTYTRFLNTNWIFYGPNAFDNAQKVRDFMFYQYFHDLLAVKNVFNVPNFPEVIRNPEPFQGQWWERVDLTMYFNEYVRREATVYYIQSAEIIIKNDIGTPDRVVEITPN